MAENILSQEEIDALLNATEQGDVPPSGNDAASEDTTVIPYTFRRPDLITNEQFRHLSSMHTALSHQLLSRLSLFLRTRIDVRLALADQQRYGEVIESMPDVSHMVLFSARPLPGTAILDINLPLMYTFMDMLLGGHGAIPPPLEREITAIEQSLFEPVMDILFEELQTMLSSVLPVSLHKEGTESTPQYAQIAGSHEPVVVICIDVGIGETHGFINLYYPMPLINELLRELAEQGRQETSDIAEARRAETRRTVLAALMDVPVRLPAVLGTVTLRAGDWIGIRPGDVLVLPQRIEEPLTVAAESEPLYHARPGRLGDQLAVRLLAPVSRERADSDIGDLLHEQEATAP